MIVVEVKLVSAAAGHDKLLGTAIISNVGTHGGREARGLRRGGGSQRPTPQASAGSTTEPTAPRPRAATPRLAQNVWRLVTQAFTRAFAHILSPNETAGFGPGVTMAAPGHDRESDALGLAARQASAIRRRSASSGSRTTRRGDAARRGGHDQAGSRSGSSSRSAYEQVKAPSMRVRTAAPNGLLRHEAGLGRQPVLVHQVPNDEARRTGSLRSRRLAKQPS